jgi:exodeoxyribonuclease-3
MKAATFNCNSVRSRLSILLPWLEANRPDLLFLQETKVTDDEFPVDAFSSAGWHVAFSGEKSYNGVAIVSRRPADSVRVGLDPALGPSDPARALWARFGDLLAVNTYVPQGRAIDHPMYPYKIDWFHRLLAEFRTTCSPTDAVLWAGDLNVARTPLDVSHPETKADHVCFHADVRAAFEEVLAFPFTDVYRLFHEGEADYTFYDYRSRFDPARRQGWRLDYLLATPPLAALATSASIDIAPRSLPRPSDHVPLLATFSRPL